MTYGNDLVTMRDRFESLNNHRAELKKDFEEYIVSSQFSLELRWQMFLDAPMELSNQEDSLYSGIDFVKTRDSNYDSWIRNQEYQRYQVVDLLDVVYNLESIVKALSKDEDNYLARIYSKMICFQDPDLVNKVKEQLLKDNTKSFIYDW